MPRSSAFSIPGVQFATRRTRREQDHGTVEPPPEGSDSCYGVRSLDGSMAWSEGSHVEHDDEVDAHEDSEDPRDTTTAITSAGSVSNVPSESGEPSEHGPDSVSVSAHDWRPDHSDTTAAPPSTPLPASTPAEPSGTPPRPAVVSSGPSPAPSPRSRRGEFTVPPPITHHALLDMLADAPSEPSSPASLASLPSCVASMSSLSRVSSPADWDWRHPLSRSVATVDSKEDDEHRHSGSAELVLPTLSLPTTSLHLGLERWDSPGQGTRIALIAGPERTRDILGVLASHRSCVQLPHGEIGILGTPNGHASATPSIQATVVACVPAENIRQRASDAYTALNALLHPSPTPQQQASLEAMVSAYASSKDWVHVAVLLDDADESVLDIVPCTTLEDEEARLAAAEAEHHDQPSSASLSPASSLSPTSSVSLPSRTPRSQSGTSLADLAVQDTPRPFADTLAWPSCEPVEGDNAPHEAERDHTPTDVSDPVHGTVALIERILDDPSRVHSASTSTFFAWRPSTRPDVSSPLTDPSSPVSSNFEGTALMPTVARAQGGGEWEATLSRRLARRRELDAAASVSSRGTRGQRAVPRGRGGRRRRSHSPPSKPPCENSLFPRRPAASSVGLVDLIASAFAPMRRFTRSRWGQVVVACALAVAVGCGIWAVRAQA